MKKFDCECQGEGCFICGYKGFLYEKEYKQEITFSAFGGHLSAEGKFSGDLTLLTKDDVVDLQRAREQRGYKKPR